MFRDGSGGTRSTVGRDLATPAPNRLWVAGLTYVRARAGCLYVSFVFDMYSRVIVDWQAAGHLRTDIARDTLEAALWQRKGAGEGLVHCNGRSGQHLAIRCTERLEGADIELSVGSHGNGFGDMLAERAISLYSSEATRHEGL